ncbi:hypothetical protein HPB49_020842 [Dermacentor silvarum]|uniref:Uncharacterized protein n=1 Tax=Dermacentor silvarum TaxID=543639 RepID=A0ACB8C5M0_DERSI|nr:hypothetical protein HPB49_020842 [Dermacentor silvarum]
MTPAREAAEFLGELFPDTPAPVKKRQWPVMAATVDDNDRRAPVRDEPDRRDPSLVYWLCLTAAVIFVAILIGVGMMRRAPGKQMVRDHQPRATPHTAEQDTEAYLPPMQYSARRLGIIGVSDDKRHLPTRKRKKEVGLDDPADPPARSSWILPTTLTALFLVVAIILGTLIIIPSSNWKRTPPKDSLICIVGEGYSRESLVFPSDGLCTIVFFNSLLTRNQLAPPYQNDFIYFLETARGHSRTEYGVGFDHEKRDALLPQLEGPNTRKHLDNLWKARIYHFGHINTGIYDIDDQLFREVLRNLKAIYFLMKDKATESRPSYTVLRVPTYTFDAVLEYVFAPDIIIVMGHYESSVFSSMKCVMTSPNMMSVPEGVGAFYSLVPALNNIHNLIKDNISSAFGLSIGLQGFVYRPLYPDSDESKPGNYSILHRCDDNYGFPRWKDAQSNVTEVCKSSSFSRLARDPKYESEFAYNKVAQRMFVYDGINGLSTKLCEGKKNVTNTPFFLAAYGIEFDDPKNYCGYGAFFRLRFLKKLVGFLVHKYTSPLALDACKKLR